MSTKNRMRRVRGSVLPAVCALVIAQGAEPARAQDPAERVGSLVLEAERMPIDRAWTVLERIANLDLNEDGKLSALESAGKRAGPIGKLVVARGLLDLDEEGFYGKKAVELVLPVLAENANLDLRVAAARLLGEENLRTRARREAGSRLAAVVKDDTAEPRLRLAAAQSLYVVGNGNERTLARKRLQEFLRSRDSSLRVAGALALAEIGDQFGMTARAVLEEIETKPTAQGRLAHALLDTERSRRNVERLEQALSKRIIASEPTRPERRDRLDLLRELLEKIKLAHIDGKGVDEEHLVEEAAKGMLRAMDRFSSYMTSDQYRRFAFDLNRDYGGIGAYVQIDPSGLFKITRPIYSGPAYRAGLLSEDQILKVDGWETADQDLDEIIRRLKGKPNTEVTIQVWRPGWPEPRDMVLTRREIRVPSVTSQLLPGDLGYVELITFGLRTNEELRAALEQLKEKGARSILMDLRNNTGGYLTQAQGVAELFLPKNKLIVSTRSTIEKSERFFSRGDPVFPEIPLVILVNHNSASASEIVSGALQDHKRAVIVGEQTFGKGSVQNLFPLVTRRGESFIDENRDHRWNAGEKYRDSNGNGKYDPGPKARLTTARYYLPHGRCLHKIIGKDGKVVNPDYGVVPDIEAKAQRLATKDLWKNAVINDLWQKRAPHGYVDEHFAANKELFEKLAENDGGTTESYPGFDAFYDGLETQLDKDDVRKLVRYVVRDRIADERGHSWPGFRSFGDYVEDRQLQTAIRVALSKIGTKIADIDLYRKVLKLDDAGKAKAGEKVGSADTGR